MAVRSVRRWGVVAVLVASLTALLAACSTTTGGGATTGLGSMSVSFQGNPSGSSPSATVTGTNGVSYDTVVTSSITLKDLAPGSYQVLPQSFTLRRNVFNGISGSATVTVTAGKTAGDTVTYTAQPGNLWVPSGTSMLEYPASTLTSGTPKTGTTITGFGGTYAAAFDASGNLWVSDYFNNQIIEYLAPSLTAGAPQKGTTITGLASPSGLAFDASGNLWIANYGNDTVVEYTASSLAAGAPKTATTISTGANNSPHDLAFDANGDLWVSEPMAPLAANPRILVVEYLASSLSTSTPKTGITITGSLALGPGPIPQPVAFDANGNLWVGNFPAPGTVQEYLASSLTTGTAKAGTALTGLPLQGGLAFDTNGNLWSSQVQNNVVVEYKAASLATGSPSTATTINVGAPQGLAFDPPPYQLPLSH